MNQHKNAKPKSNIDKLENIKAQLPECVHGYFDFGSHDKAILTKLNYARDLLYFFEYTVNFLPYFPEKKTSELTIENLKAITPNDINKFVTWMKDKQDLSERTCARRRSSVSIIYNYLINTERKLDFNPVTGSEGISIEQSDFVTYLNLDEQAKLLDCIQYGTGLTKRELAFHEKYKKRDLAIIFLFLDTGLRISELQALNVNDVVIYDDLIKDDSNECFVLTLRKGKKRSGKTPSKVYFSDESKEYIQDYLKSREIHGEKFDSNTPLFITLEGNRLSVRQIQQMLKKYVRASLHRSDISVHKLRSSFAMEFYKAEHDILVLQNRMGHASIAATNIYARASDKEDAVKASRNWRGKKI